VRFLFTGSMFVSCLYPAKQYVIFHITS